MQDAPRSGVADPGATEAKPLLTPGRGALMWLGMIEATPPASPTLPASRAGGVLAQYADIVLPINRPRTLTRTSSDEVPGVLLKMTAVVFIATVVLIPMACSITTGAMFAYPRDGPSDGTRTGTFFLCTPGQEQV